MSKHLRIVLVIAALASIVLVVACGVTPVDEPVTEPEGQGGAIVEEPPPPPCPPMGPKATKVAVSDKHPSYPNDGSSIEVFDETHCQTDGAGDPWCATEDLDIEPYPKTSLSTCPYGECLVAVDLGPDNIYCPTYKNPPSTPYPDGTKPELSIDLDEHKPTKKTPEECTGVVHCYAFYYETSKWTFVGWAEPKWVDPEWYAVGRIYHLSIYALVELPDPTPVAGPRTVSMVVASDFIEDAQGNIGVGVMYLEDELGELDQGGEHRIWLFSGVDPGSLEGQPPDCMALPSVAEQFTCLFPIDTFVELELPGDGQAVLRAPEAVYGIEFSVSDVQIY